MEISEAGQAVLDHQLSNYTALSDDEQVITVEIDTDNFDAGADLDAVAVELGLIATGPE